MNNKILVVVAHPDDEIIGVAGTLKRHIDLGDEVRVIILGEGQTSRYSDRKEVPKEILEDLHNDSYLAAECIGYNKIYFANFPDNRFDEAVLLDIVKYIENIIEEYKPDMIYTHHGGDLNIDHQYSFRATMTATRPIRGKHIVKKIYSFETLSATEWNFDTNSRFMPNYFVCTDNTIDAKLKAMSCYKSELCKAPHPRSIEIIECSARKWGSVIGTKYAEAFEVVRCIEY